MMHALRRALSLTLFSLVLGRKILTYIYFIYSPTYTL